MNPSILLVGNFLSASGGARGVCEELALRLAVGGMRVITTSAQPARIPRLFDMLWTVHRQRARYAVAQVDVYSGPAFIWAEAVCAWLKRLGKPFILTLHGGNLPDFARRHARRVRRLLASADAVTTPSRFLLERMSGHGAELHLLPNALELGRYPFRLRERAAPSLIWLRAFHEIYNPALATEVVKLLVGQFPKIHLTMVGPDKGDGSLVRARALAAKWGVANRVSFPGAVSKEQVPEWLQRADIFLNTTNIDNTPVSVLEAMACGLCVVSTNVGGLPYLLKSEQTALLVPPKDAEAMSAAVRRLLVESDLPPRLSQSARTQVEAHDWRVILPQWQELFRTLARRVSPNRTTLNDNSISCARGLGKFADRAP
ncbi:MAG: putative glycosyltransferase [Pedosphaera sp.]|nr:putative glycosyltransferase [Pedosphaera sp.]